MKHIGCGRFTLSHPSADRLIPFLLHYVSEKINLMICLRMALCCGEGGITLTKVCGGLRCATARTLRLLFPFLLHFVAERAGFEPAIHFWRIHTFQACSFNHSDTSPQFVVSSHPHKGCRSKRAAKIQKKCAF